MADLRKMCSDLGLANPKTLLASGNVVFETVEPREQVKEKLETALHAYAGKPVGTFVLTKGDVDTIAAQNPFPDHPPNQVGVLVADPLPSEAELTAAKGLKDEVMMLGDLALYVKFPHGMGQSKLTVPASDRGTMRNMNTIVKIQSALNA